MVVNLNSLNLKHSYYWKNYFMIIKFRSMLIIWYQNCLIISLRFPFRIFKISQLIFFLLRISTTFFQNKHIRQFLFISSHLMSFWNISFFFIFEFYYFMFMSMFYAIRYLIINALFTFKYFYFSSLIHCSRCQLYITDQLYFKII